MLRVLKWVVVPVAVAALCMASADGAIWKYHFKSSYVAPGQSGPCPGGDLRVYGTINCVKQEPPLFSGYAVRCQEYTGSIPPAYNDIRYEFDWDYVCHNKDRYKQAVPKQTYPGGPWYLEQLASWVDTNILTSLIVPSLGDPTGTTPNIFVMVDLATWLNNQQPLQDWYTFSNGQSSQLPGFRVGTAEFVFNPNAPYPFVNLQPFTGMLERDADVTLIPEPTAAVLLAVGLLLRRR